MGMLITMPRYGANMEEGTLAEWFVEEGAAVEKGEALCEIEIEKLTNELESPASGVLRRILCPEGETRECGAAIAVVAGEEEDIDGLLAEAAQSQSPSAEEDSKPAAQTYTQGQSKTQTQGQAANQGQAEAGTGAGTGAGAAPSGPAPAEVRITPRARKLAAEKGLNYKGLNIEGSGFHGALTRQDIKDYLAAAGEKSGKKPEEQAGATPGETADTRVNQRGPQRSSSEAVPMSPIRRATAKAMMKSMGETAQTTIMMDAWVDEMVKRYSTLKEEYAGEGVKLSYTAIAVKAAATALVKNPEIRTVQAGEGQIKTLTSIDIGVAVDLGQGLMVPVLRDCDSKDEKTLCRDLAEMVDRAKAGSLGPADFGGAALSISNVGMLGVRYFTPILNPPESAILGLGTLAQEAVIQDGGIFPAWVWALSMTYDHRIIDGAPAARFLGAMRELLNSVM